MIKELNLSGNELVLYAILFEEAHQNHYFGARQTNEHYAEMINTSSRTVSRIISVLVEKKVVSLEFTNDRFGRRREINMNLEK